MSEKTIVSILIMLSLTTFAYAELRFNQQTRMLYSEGAKKNVNQQSYHNLALEMMAFQLIETERGVFSEKQIDQSIFAYLRMIGSPAALRLIEDLKNLTLKTQQDLEDIDY